MTSGGAHLGLWWGLWVGLSVLASGKTLKPYSSACTRTPNARSFNIAPIVPPYTLSTPCATGCPRSRRLGLALRARKRKGGNGAARSERLEVIYQRVLEFEFEIGLTDPVLAGVSLLQVEMHKQLSVVRAYVSGDAKESESIKEALKRAKGYLRSAMAREVSIMRTPDLKFIFVPSMGSPATAEGVTLSSMSDSRSRDRDDESDDRYGYGGEERYQDYQDASQGDSSYLDLVERMEAEQRREILRRLGGGESDGSTSTSSRT